MKMWNKSIFETRRWFTFGEILGRSGESPTQEDVAYPLPYEDVNELADFSDFLGTACALYFTKTDTTEQGIINKLLTEIYARYYDHYVFATEEEILSGTNYTTEFETALSLFRTRFTSIFNQTYDRYMNLVKTYQSQLSKLLDSVKTKSTGVGKFSDTPQNAIVNGYEFGDNGHISNLTKSENETETEFDTKMGRIDEIQRKFRNILKDWSEEWNGLFIEDGNIK